MTRIRFDGYALGSALSAHSIGAPRFDLKSTPTTIACMVTIRPAAVADAAGIDALGREINRDTLATEESLSALL